jgi:hypothetical protein
LGDTYNIYCDESCYLLNDRNDIMILGGISCPIQYVRTINNNIKQLKLKYNLNNKIEIKWTKVSGSKINLYKELIDLLVDTPYLNFRGIIITGKTNLDHEAFNQDHDTWYYKMYYYLIREMVRIGNVYRVYVDIKDTKSADKIIFLQHVLNNSLYDFYNETVERIQTVRSDEVNILQLTDLIIGALSYINRGLVSSQTKVELTNYLSSRVGLDLMHTTSRDTQKFNIFKWSPRR